MVVHASREQPDQTVAEKLQANSGSFPLSLERGSLRVQFAATQTVMLPVHGTCEDRLLCRSREGLGELSQCRTALCVVSEAVQALYIVVKEDWGCFM